MPQEFPILTAKAKLSELIDVAIAGEEVVIAKDGKPVIRLVAIAQSKFKIELMKDRLGDSAPDFFAPIGEDELLAWEGGC